jgi:hypothetical protein
LRRPVETTIITVVLRSGDSWEFRTEADDAIRAKPGYPKCVAMIVQIGDHLGKQFDLASRGIESRPEIR